jgi:hypothetical protein
LSFSFPLAAAINAVFFGRGDLSNKMSAQGSNTTCLMKLETNFIIYKKLLRAHKGKQGLEHRFTTGLCNLKIARKMLQITKDMMTEIC